MAEQKASPSSREKIVDLMDQVGPDPALVERPAAAADEPAKFSTDGRDLYVYGLKVLRAWESYSGWYWFGTEPPAMTGEAGIWFGFVQGFEEEWGYFSETEIRATPGVWPINPCDLPFSGRRSR